MNRQAAEQLPASVNNAGSPVFASIRPTHTARLPAAGNVSKKDMPHGSRGPLQRTGNETLGRLLLRFAIPSIFAQIVNLLYNIVDRIFVGRIPEIGPLALAGSASPSPSS